MTRPRPLPVLAKTFFIYIDDDRYSGMFASGSARQQKIVNAIVQKIGEGGIENAEQE